MPKGGKREGAGRKKGVPNKHRADFIVSLQRKKRVDKLVDKLMELAEGVHVERNLGGDLITVYKKPPDATAITYMLDQAFGKPKQSVAIGGEDGPIKFVIDLRE